MCTIKLPAGVIENIDRIRKQCLWRGNDRTKKGGCLAAWPMIMKPKLKGGLGVINLRLQNDALLLKQLHKFYNKRDIPWVQLVWSKYYANGKVPHGTKELGSFLWKELLRLSVFYRGIARCQIGDGASVLFWEDLWSSEVLALKYPCLFSFVRNTSLSMKNVRETEDLDTLFTLPLSEQAFNELQDLQLELHSVPYDDAQIDSWVFIWGSSIYSSQKFYALSFKSMATSPCFTWL